MSTVERLEARVQQARVLSSLLSTMRQKKTKASGELRANQDGIELDLTGESKALRALTKVPRAAMKSYSCPRTPVRADIPLGSVADALAMLIFAAGSEGDICIRWPGRDGRLMLEMGASRREDSARLVRNAAFASVAAEEAPQEDIPDHPEEESPAAEAKLPSGTFKELADDVEWPAGDVVMSLDTPAGSLSLAVRGSSGEAEVKAAVEASGEPPSGALHYKHRHLKQAASLPTSLIETATVAVGFFPSGKLRVCHSFRLGPSSSGPPTSLSFFLWPISSVL